MRTKHPPRQRRLRTMKAARSPRAARGGKRRRAAGGAPKARPGGAPEGGAQRRDRVRPPAALSILKGAFRVYPAGRDRASCQARPRAKPSRIRNSSTRSGELRSHDDAGHMSETCTHISDKPPAGRHAEIGRWPLVPISLRSMPSASRGQRIHGREAHATFQYSVREMSAKPVPQLRQAFIGGLPDERPQGADAVDQPGQFLVGDLVVRGVASVDVGAAEQFEAALFEAAAARPGLDQPRVRLFALRPQEAELVGLGTVERPDQQEAVV